MLCPIHKVLKFSSQLRPLALPWAKPARHSVEKKELSRNAILAIITYTAFITGPTPAKHCISRIKARVSALRTLLSPS